MTLEKVISQFLEQAAKARFEGGKYERIVTEFSVTLEKFTEQEALYQTINDHDLMLSQVPVEIGIQIYHRLLELNHTASDLRSFAFYLQLRGPDWDEMADKMLQVADFLDTL
jgi:hypothetical protein